MNRFSVIYLFQKQFYHIPSATYAEADDLLNHLLSQENCKPIGIYDAKTELFVWEPSRQHAYDMASFEQQGKSDEHMVQIAQTLRQRDEANPNQASGLVPPLVEVNPS